MLATVTDESVSLFATAIATMLLPSPAAISTPPWRLHPLFFVNFHHRRSLNSRSVHNSGSNFITPLTTCSLHSPLLALFPISSSSCDTSSSYFSNPHVAPLQLSILKHVAASVVIFFGFTLHACAAHNVPVLVPPPTLIQKQSVQDENDDEDFKAAAVGVTSVFQEETTVQDESVETVGRTQEDKRLDAEFERWKSKTYALSVPLRVIGLRGSVPPSWLKEFIQSQTKRLRLRSEVRGSLEDIYNELLKSFGTTKIDPKSAIAADVVSMGDSWLPLAIKNSTIVPMDEGQDWFRNLNHKWKIFLRRNNEGIVDNEGQIWAAPYRWGSMVICYKKSKFQKHNLTPIEDWADLWQPGLEKRISMVGCPREIVGAILKHMGASYNIESIDLQVAGGRDAVLENLSRLRKQVRLFDSENYLKAFGVGDVWVAVGWSSDILPAAKRMSNVAVIVPRSGASLWADLWTIPAASNLKTDQIGGRVRGPSPLTYQWIEFCLQPARALPFKKEVVPGASPSALDSSLPKSPLEFKGSPKLETNLIAGVPPPDILSKCEFLEPLSTAASSDFEWLITTVQRSEDNNLINRLQKTLFSTIQAFTSNITKASS